MKKRLSSVLLAGVMTLGLFSGCGSSEPENIGDIESEPPVESTAPETTPAEGDAEELAQEMTFVLTNLPDGLDPGVTSNSFAKYVLFNSFEGLVTYNSDGDLIPGMAESWSISDDGTVYTFKLREGLKWSDGSEFTADDFVFSMLRVATPETGAEYANLVTDYILNADKYFAGEVGAEEVGVKALDATTLEITLNQPTSFFINILSMWAYSPVQQETVEANGDAWSTDAATYVSNGPFKVTKVTMNEDVVLEKNEHYWNADAVTLEKITYRYILDTATALTAFETGEVDGVDTIPSGDYQRLVAEDAGVRSFPSYATTFYAINNNSEVFKDPLVRKALNLAIDREALIENVIQVDAEPAFSFLAPGYTLDGVDITEGRSDYGLSATADPEAAQAALAEAGYPNGEGFPPLQLSFYSNDTIKQVTEAMAEMFKENLNIEVEISSNEWAIFNEDVIAGNYEVGALGWGADYLHPMTFMPLMKTDDSTNKCFYSNPEYDALVEQIMVETDPAAAAELIMQADEIASNEYPVIPLYYRSTNILMSDNVEGYAMNSTSALFFKDAKMVG